MNDATDHSSTPGPWFSPGLFLAGLFAGLVMLAAAGHWAGRHNTHPGAARLHPRISPEGSYHPTLDELCAMVRSRCRPGQILVIVGGNSIFNGVGQPADKLWTHELQAQLGERFAVVNLALRGAISTDGGAVVAEVLREEFPRLIYLANTAPHTPPAPLGEAAYHYIFWEAHYRGLLMDFAPRNEALEDYLNHGAPWMPRRDYTPDSWHKTFLRQKDRVTAEMHRGQLMGEVWLDAALKYRDLWNWIGYEHVFTVPSFYTPRWPGLTAARGKLADDEQDYETMDFYSPHRFASGKTPTELLIVRGFSQLAYTAGGDEGWVLNESTRNRFLSAARSAVPDALKARTLILLSRNSPYYLQMLAPEEIRRDDLAYRDSIAAWREAGYAAEEYGRDFTPEDYGDRTHLTVSGGRKLAVVAAREVETLARNLGYITEGGK